MMKGLAPEMTITVKKMKRQLGGKDTVSFQHQPINPAIETFTGQEIVTHAIEINKIRIKYSEPKSQVTVTYRRVRYDLTMSPVAWMASMLQHGSDLVSKIAHLEGQNKTNRPTN